MITTNIVTEDGQKVDVTIDGELVVEVARAVYRHGGDVVLWGWRTFFQQFLPFAGLLLAENDLVNAAKDSGLTKERALDALSLMGLLSRTDSVQPDEHRAWLAAEILLRVASKPILERVLAAAAPAEGRGN